MSDWIRIPARYCTHLTIYINHLLNFLDSYLLIRFFRTLIKCAGSILLSMWIIINLLSITLIWVIVFEIVGQSVFPLVIEHFVFFKYFWRACPHKFQSQPINFLLSADLAPLSPERLVIDPILLRFLFFISISINRPEGA